MLSNLSKAEMRAIVSARTLRDAATGCLNWTGALNDRGYPTIRGGRDKVYVHRLVWWINRGPIPTGLFVCHHCDNPKCVEIAHLFTGTHAENMRDMVMKGRWSRPSPVECKRGHAFDSENTLLCKAPGGGVQRQCRKCNHFRYLRRFGRA